MRKLLIALLAYSCLASSTSAKTIDLRNQTDADGALREISFCARPSPDKAELPGHAFVSFSIRKKDGTRAFRAIGHTVFSVVDALISYSGLIPASGALIDERYTAIKQECLTLQVNQSDYEASYALAAQPLLAVGIKFDEKLPIQKAYTLGAEDCVGFVIGQTKRYAQKVVVPKRTTNELPLPYIRRLIDAN